MNTKRKQGVREFFQYGNYLLSLRDLLMKPEIVGYLTRDGSTPSQRTLCGRLRRGLRDGSINEQVVLEWSTETASKAKPIPAPRVKPTPAPRTRPVPIPRKILGKLRPTPPPRTQRAKPVPSPRTQRVEPIPPPRPSTKEATCDHGTLEEIDGVTFCVLCGLETDRSSYRWGSSYREVPRRFVFRREEPVFKRRPGEQKKYIPISPSEADLLSREETGGETRNEILKCLGLLEG